MSLINEALKKAQRARTDGQPADAPPVPGGGAITKRGEPKSARTMVLIGGGAVAVLLLAVAITLYFVGRSRSAAKPVAAEPAPHEAKETPEKPIAVVEPTEAPKPAPVVVAPAPKPVPTEARPAEIPKPAAPIQPAPPPPPPKPDERITAYVEALKVAGIRSSGDDSRVLMNERVYRVNDIVERTLGVKLVKVSVDSLTFADANGVTYVKYF